MPWSLAAAVCLSGTSAATPGPGASTSWPGDAAVSVADDADELGENPSGLSFESPDALWAVRNGPSTLYRLVPDGSTWHTDPADGWVPGKALHYRDGGGDPDAEGVVVTPDGMFVSTERANDGGDDSLQKILRFDSSSSSASLDATTEWDLTADLPDSPANEGIEGISWVPDTYLTAHGLHDEHADAAYEPSGYPGHGSGLYLVGLESDGAVYAYALDLAGGGFTRVSAFPSGLPAVMDLEFEPEPGQLWAVCDDTCEGRSTTLDIDTQGRYAVTAEYERPGEMPDYNNEGFAIAARSVCSAGRKQVLWTDDGNDDGHALRSGNLPCAGAEGRFDPGLTASARARSGGVAGAGGDSPP